MPDTTECPGDVLGEKVEARPSSDPLGVVVMIIDPNGRVVGQGVDFDQSCGHLRLVEAQERRAEAAAWGDLVNIHCSSIVAGAIRPESWAMGEIQRHLIDTKGYRRHVTLVGHTGG